MSQSIHQPPEGANSIPQGRAANQPRRQLRRRLSSRIGLRLVYNDETEFGSVVSDRCERELRNRFAVLYGFRAKYGLPQLVHEASGVLGRIWPKCLDGIYQSPTCLNRKWLYPEPDQVRPAELLVERDIDKVISRIPLPTSLVSDLARYLGEWELGAKPPSAVAARVLWDSLVDCGALVTTAQRTVGPCPAVEASFTGHATLTVTDGHSRVLLDPYLVPKSTRYPRTWQPPTLAEIGRPDAILVTHSHPDHFDLGTLLRCGADTPIYVPAVSRESVLAVDMAARLSELGFRQVHTLADWDRFSIGELDIVALPFFGEQPTTADWLHSEIRNRGITYRVQAGGRGIVALADSGRDGAGDVKDVATLARRRYGVTDTVFGGYRGFALYPVQYVFSSVSRYLPFVPPERWGERQKIMCDADDLIDVGERIGAHRVVPYAAGGAPWHWLRGLGPCLDDSADDTRSIIEPRPEHVSAAAAQRGITLNEGAIASPLKVLPLKVGDSLALADSESSQ